LFLFLSACTQTTISETAQIQVACGRGPIITAINRANDDPDPSTLVLEQDCEIIFYTEDNHEGIYGMNALPLITSPVTILGNSAILDSAGAGRLFYITSEGSLRLEDLTLDHGYAIVTTGTTGPGGGLIANEDGVLTLHNVILQNSYGAVGGAIWNSGSLIIEEGTVFENNRAGLGGAIFIAGSAGIPISITDTTFVRNIASTNYWGDYGIGGTIYVEGTDGAGLQISDTTITGSKAIYKGGAIYAEDPSGVIMLYNSNLDGNKSYVDGGAIYLEAGTISIVDSSFRYNSSGHYSTTYSVPTDILPSGGGIYIMSGSLDILESEIIDSFAEYEGGFLLNKGGDVTIIGSNINGGETYFIDRHSDDYPSFGGCISNYNTLTVQNTSIQGCKSFTGGGLINHTQASAVLNNVTMSYNSPVLGFGGHIYNRGDLDLNFVTFYQTRGGDGNGLVMYMHGGRTRVKDSIIYNYPYVELENLCIGNEGNLEPVGENYIFGGECLGFDLQDINLLNHFGNGFYDLELDSPALDGASSCLDLNGNPVLTDQLGVNRPQPTGGQCDSGAIEMPQIPGPPPPTPQILPRLFTPENLSCREGDSMDYPTAGYLMAGESADVIGQNQAGTWLVINNPDWDGICWLFEGNVILEGSLEGVSVLTAPLLSQFSEEEAGEDNGRDNGSTPVCTGSLEAEECKKAGGTYNIQNLPACKCP